MMMMMRMMETLLLMVLTHTAGTQDIHTVSKISVQKQQTVTIPCLYDHKYVAFPKYLSSGGFWVFSHTVSNSRMSFVDNQTEKVFTATLREAEVRDSGRYWCAVEVSGSDPHTSLYLEVTEAKAKPSVSSQRVSGYEGGNVTILCHGASHWCNIRGACVRRDGVRSGRTAVDAHGGALRVRLWPLKKEDSGWYYCSGQDSQMPVHLSVMDAIVITESTASPCNITTAPQHADRQLLWLNALGLMLPVTVCGAVMLIKARNKRKQRAEISNLQDVTNKQQLSKETVKNGEVMCENLYEFMTGNKPITQESGRNNEVSYEDLYECTPGDQPNDQENGKNNEVACEDLYETMTGNKQKTKWKNEEVACEDLYETMNAIKTQLTAAPHRNIYSSTVRKVKT